MVRAICTFNKERVEEMSRKMRNKTIWISVVISAVLFCLGVIDIILSLTASNEIDYLSLGVGIIIVIASPYPIYKAIKTEKANYNRTIEAMKLDTGDLTFDYTIKDKKIELKTTQSGSVNSDTILIRNIDLVKNQQDGLGIYVGEHLFYIANKEIVEGSKEELLRIFTNAGVKIKKAK